MRRSFSNNVPRMINGFVLTNEQMKEFDVFMQKYGNQPDRVIFREIQRAKNNVSDEVLQQHITNLDHLSQMGGFVTAANKERIAAVRRVLISRNPSFNKKINNQSTVESQYVSGTSLLLWFLILAAIW
ncbi:hypothetical protein [Crassaminicella profunda]|uniref:hypothetical protein n=1 Tax=Crassaminicella profunda TaxID=1286698 RepID=UPI001CA75E99|nr:hypothetical protein [Crassaminicella profunda]QZY53799.1 hypothetical protein K7H06_12095 [Crassaminicella profunda]